MDYKYRVTNRRALWYPPPHSGILSLISQIHSRAFLLFGIGLLLGAWIYSVSNSSDHHMTVDVEPQLQVETTKTVTIPTVEQITAEGQASLHHVKPESKPALPESPDLHWKTTHVQKGDTLSRIFHRLGLSNQDLYAILNLGEEIKPLKHLFPQQLLRFQVDAKNQIQHLLYPLSATDTLEIQRVAKGFQSHLNHRNTELHQEVHQGSIHHSLYLDGQAAGLAPQQINQLAAIFAWDIDFAKSLQPGDTFKVLLEKHYLDGKAVKTGNILAAEFVNNGKTFQAIRFTNKNGQADYYTPEGLSVRRPFLRTPVKFSRISSYFSNGRKHPILHRIRAHRGVDYAAPMGTPAKATSDGVVQFIGWKGGYGRAVILKHGHGYNTLYGHLSRFNKKLHRGSKVHQGQVIAYVGQSGLATGPHLHYEFRINGVHRDPLKVKLPKARPISEQYREAFQAQATTLMAELQRPSTTA